jgi:hypothetical protein
MYIVFMVAPWRGKQWGRKTTKALPALRRYTNAVEPISRSVELRNAADRVQRRDENDIADGEEHGAAEIS